MDHAVESFAASMRARNLIPPSDFITDGKIHRCHVDARHGKGDGSYVLHLDGLPAGAYINWTDGIGWQKWHAEVGRRWSDAEKRAYRERIAKRHGALRLVIVNAQMAAIHKAMEMWKTAKPANADHPYLKRKGVLPHDIRQIGNMLLVPMVIGDQIYNLQRIFPDGSKRFLSGGRTNGCYCILGKAGDTLCIAEGFATAASVYEATEYATAIAFSANNLREAGISLRKHYPSKRFIFCADNDYTKEINTGLIKAREAAVALRGYLAVPCLASA